MIVLALDTADSRGSIALWKDGELISVVRREGDAEYSSWLLASVSGLLANNGAMESVDVVAACTGPGSFTGLRIGLTTVKGWAEVYGMKVVGVSRLEAMAKALTGEGWVTACYDAQRGHVFGALYRREGDEFAVVEADMVVAPGEFLAIVGERAGDEPVRWVSLDPEQITGLEGWRLRAGRGDTMAPCAPELAVAIAKIGEKRAAKGEFADPLVLDANYVRRSDAEIFWKAR